MNNQRFVRSLLVSLLMCGLAAPALAQIDLGRLGNKAVRSAGNAGRDKALKQVNAKLLAEGRKNQCSFKTDSDELMAGCDAKMKRLANALIEVKSRLAAGKITDYKFEVSGHTDSRGKADHNQKLSEKRAAVIARELAERGVPAKDIISIGRGSERPIVKVDNTPAKQARNRRYEIQVRL